MRQLTSNKGILGANNIFAKKADPKHNEVWVLDNLAFRPTAEGETETQPWEAEFVACFFRTGRKDITRTVSNIADLIGLDGISGNDPEARARIEERLMPFVQAIAPARTVDINLSWPDPARLSHSRLLGPSNMNGISSQLLLAGGGDDMDGQTATGTSTEFPAVQFKTRYVGPQGWAIISDVDDTIKLTQTSNPLGILQSTFADVPQPAPGMSELYRILHEALESPAWLYLSASPYNLYPFLSKFISQHYPAGTLILRPASWMYLGGLLQSFTEGVQAYKTERMEKIHSWLPKRKFICIGDSTQADPESYAQMYAKYPEWIKAIYIRKVTDIPHMENKNKNQRFIEAFKDVPDHVWRVFVNPQELADHIKHLSGQAHSGIVGAMLGVWCGTHQDMKQAHTPSKSQSQTPLPHTPEAATPRGPSPQPQERQTLP